MSGPSAATGQDIPGGRGALNDVTNDQFGARERRPVGLVHVAAAGRYTEQVLVYASYYDEPAKYRLNILALSVSITPRPRRTTLA